MKKIIIIFIAILIGVYIILSIVTSGQEYAAERLMYRAAKAYAKIKANPDVAPPSMLVSVEKDLKALIAKYPKTPSGKTAHLRLAEIYVSVDRYDEAIDSLDIFIAATKDDISALSKAHFLKAIAYERQDKWDKALEEFNILKSAYIDTPVGLQAPLYIADYYARNNRRGEAKRQLNNAALFYKGLEEANRGILLGYAAASLLVQVYTELERYEEAGAVLENIINNYPGDMVYMQQLARIESVFIKVLKSPEKAAMLYGLMAEKTQDAKLKKFLQDKIEGLSSK